MRRFIRTCGAPPGVPFHFDRPTISRGLNVTLATAVGDLDLLGEVTGGGTYDSLLPHTITGTFGALSVLDGERAAFFDVGAGIPSTLARARQGP